MNTNNTLQYIAESNPNKAAFLCTKYGFPVAADNKEAVFFGLSTLIDGGDEDVLKEVIAIHPDKELVLELFSKPTSRRMLNFSGSSCDECVDNKMIGTYPKPYFANAGGATEQKSDSIGIQKVTTMMQQNTLLMIGIIGVVAAIIISKSK